MDYSIQQILDILCQKCHQLEQIPMNLVTILDANIYHEVKQQIRQLICLCTLHQRSIYSSLLYTRSAV